MKRRLDPETMGMRLAKEFWDGAVVNLGAGLPAYAYMAAVLDPDKDAVFHSENGIVGYGRPLREDERELWDMDLINATGNFVLPKPGMCIMDHAQSFDMIRGGHIDITVLGAYQVSEKGDLANWISPNRPIPSVGGAMDLAASCRQVFVIMEHTTKDGQPKIVKICSYPLTAKACVDIIMTDLGLFEVTQQGIMIQEIAPGWTIEEVQALTEPKLLLAKDLKEIQL
jgi:3-oxoacid CoA-transferase subunit B